MLPLTAADQEHKIAGAALDVFSEEPLPEDHELRKLDNVTLTPHIKSESGQNGSYAISLTPNPFRRSATFFPIMPSPIMPTCLFRRIAGGTSDQAEISFRIVTEDLKRYLRNEKMMNERLSDKRSPHLLSEFSILLLPASFP